MANRNLADTTGGIVIALFGAAVAVYAAQNYNLGTLRRVGPGMMPMALGVLIGALGAAIALNAWIKGRADALSEAVEWRTATLIIIAVIAFALMIQPFGLIPSVIAVVGISAFSDNRANPVNVAILCAALCLLAWAIFRLALGMNFALIRWPF
ncbi:MAG: tripartite tricarboxylate transporter TctB family protein [Paracoccus sp. (in: a-proteobacteria)]|uniref:tripartite tricarboxylate transporter TctB family protein n=1 Tax=Paracoccus sp. TaxID=267 RepID=UPI0026E06F24|nr:tripartite tricarboxylate transporter TctB family protein [Paracoccus sp. (in: a-proteobacteria)]MDO5631611.1 tripartite tricarboxylate transporter TctB family protein [Paracoccus sp. (in: a-proteobacteria)]